MFLRFCLVWIKRGRNLGTRWIQNFEIGSVFAGRETYVATNAQIVRGQPKYLGFNPQHFRSISFQNRGARAAQTCDFSGYGVNVVVIVQVERTVNLQCVVEKLSLVANFVSDQVFRIVRRSVAEEYEVVPPDRYPDVAEKYIKTSSLTSQSRLIRPVIFSSSRSYGR